VTSNEPDACEADVEDGNDRTAAEAAAGASDTDAIVDDDGGDVDSSDGPNVPLLPLLCEAVLDVLATDPGDACHTDANGAGADDCMPAIKCFEARLEDAAEDDDSCCC
jgi:hypothetical protein